jgi:hypothetical protein
MVKKNFGEAIIFGNNLKIGTCVAEVRQGSNRQIIKMVKQ